MTCRAHAIPDRYCADCREQALAPPLEDCPICGGSGYTPIYAGHLQQSVARHCDCTLRPYQPPTVDADGDGWFDDWPVQPARFYGPRLDPGAVVAAVMHCGSTGSDNFGGYFANPLARVKLPDGSTRLQWRRVSAHASAGNDLSVRQHVQYTHQAHHAKGKNSVSVGIEFPGPETRHYPDGIGELALTWVCRMMDVYPNLREIWAHSWISPASRRDPGPWFPFHVFDDRFVVHR